MKNKAAQQLGRLGGKVTSEAKAAAVRENGKKGGRPSRLSQELRAAEIAVAALPSDDPRSANKIMRLDALREFAADNSYSAEAKDAALEASGFISARNA